MANCNCNDFPISCAPHAPGGDCCHHPHGCPPHPCPPPDYKGGTSMYIGARYVPIFADPVEWDDEREYEPLTIVTHNGDCYTSKCYVPKGAQLPPYPDGQTKYWVKTSDYNYQFADLKKTVTDLSRLVEQFQKDNEKFTELINGWNEKVIQWEKDMAAWGERLDTVESTVSDLTDSLNAEIARAKAAEQANAAAIAKETTDRQQAISELDAAYKAADTALGVRIDNEAALREAGDNAVKALVEQEQARAEGEESAIRHEFAAADTDLSNRITSNKTDINAIKAEQAIQNTNISNNAKNISDNSAEIAKHAARLTSLESNASDWDEVFPDTTIAQEVQKEELARANGDTALNGRCDAIAADVEEVRDIANHKVDTTVYTAGQAAQDAKITTAQNDANKANATIGDWKTDHPGQTISECATSLENEVEAVDAKADANRANIGDWNTEHPGKTISQAVSLNTRLFADAVRPWVPAFDENGNIASYALRISPELMLHAGEPGGSIVTFDVSIPGPVKTTDHFTLTKAAATPMMKYDGKSIGMSTPSAAFCVKDGYLRLSFQGSYATAPNIGYYTCADECGTVTVTPA